MKNLLVVGDSFMSADRWNPKYAGKHWTEKCTKYNIYNLAFPGYSNYNIINKLHLALEKKLRFDYLLVWFTDHRLTFPKGVNDNWLTGQDTVTDCSPQYLTKEQNIAQKYYFTEVSDYIMIEQTAYEILGTIHWLKNKNFKFLFNFGQYGFKHIKFNSSTYSELREIRESNYYFPEIDIAHYTINNKLILDPRSGPCYHTKEFWQDHLVSCVEKKFEEVYGE
jgi:hypothetical protein